MRPVPLQEWANANNQDDSGLIYASGLWDQVLFVRDVLPGIVYKMYHNFEIADQVSKGAQVLSTHISKSVVLPVFLVDLPDGTKCVMRCNFHDWKVSVKASHLVTANFVELFDPDETVGEVYCEGFPEEWVFGSFNNNQQEFTVELNSKFEVFMFFYLLVNNLAQ